MESQGLVSDESWSSFDLTTVVDESEVMMHLFGAHQYLHEQEQEKSGIATRPMFWTDHSADNSYYYSENTNCNPYFSTSDSSNFLHNISNFEGYYSNDAGVNFSNADEQTTQTSMPPFPVSSCHRFTEAVMNEETSNDGIAHSISDQSSQSMKRMLHNDYADKSAAQAQRDDIQFGSPKKKTCRASVQVSKKGKNVQFKKQKKSASGYNDADSNPDMNGQSSRCYSSEDDDSNASQDTKRAGTSSISSKGKTRADRGSATDPQSLYARKRRERINERLRILQTLVPNGTKVDISTMLEEAVQYVKFLQLQIKLLSSDEMWMYAPIAYNGMNLGFDLKVPAPSASSKRS